MDSSLTQKYPKIAPKKRFMGRLHQEPFCNISFDDVLILLSLTWELLRQYQADVKTVLLPCFWKLKGEIVGRFSVAFKRHDRASGHGW